MRPPGRRHLIRYCISVIAALAAAGYGAIALAPGTAAAPVRAASSTATPRHIPAAPHVPGKPDFGPNVYVFAPSMPQSQIQATVNAIASQQVPNQFGTQRYALFFEPGTYGTHADPLTFQVGYYTQVAGLGASPGDVVINGAVDVFNQCFGAGNTNCFALDNFWRSLSNLTINVTASPSVSGCQGSADFWATSQAAPMRRVQVNGFFTLQDYCTAGPQFASGGFIADSVFHGSTILNGSQQQFIVRNSNLDGWTGVRRGQRRACPGFRRARRRRPVHDAGHQPGDAGGAVPLRRPRRRIPGVCARSAERLGRADLDERGCRGSVDPGEQVLHRHARHSGASDQPRARARPEPDPHAWRLSPEPGDQGEQAGHDRPRARAGHADPGPGQHLNARR